MAMINISIGNGIEARRLKECIDQGRFFHSRLSEVKKEADALTDASDVTGVAVAFGVHTRDANGNFTTDYDLTKASDLWYLLSGALTALEAASAAMDLLYRVTPES